MGPSIDTTSPATSYSPPVDLTPLAALGRLWLRPRTTLAGLAVHQLGYWLMPIGLALGVFYVRLAILPWLGLPISDVTVVRGALAIMVGWPLAAFLLYRSCQWLGAHPHFLHLLLLSMWSTLPLTLRGGVQLFYTIVTGHAPTHAGLAGLLAAADQREPLVRVGYFLLGQLDLFTLWHLALLAVTLQVATGVAWRVAWRGVALYVGVLLLIGIILALLALSLSPR